MASGSFGGRLGLVWESSRFIHDKRTYVVRVVQKSTAVKTPGPPLFASAPPAIGAVVLIFWLPIRVVALLIYRNSFKVALVEVDAYPVNERIVERHTTQGEKKALALAHALVTQRHETSG